MTNLATNTSLLIDPSPGIGTTPYIATLVYNFAIHFGVLPFFLLIVLGVAIAVGGFLVWKKFFSKQNTNSTLTVQDIEMIVITAQQPTLEKITQILENIKSHLRTDEVVIVLRIVENYFVYEVVDICKSIQHMAPISDVEIKRIFCERVDATLRIIDRELLKLPDINTATANTNSKIKSIADRADDFVLVIKNENRYDTLKKTIETLVRSTAIKEWYK